MNIAKSIALSLLISNLSTIRPAEQHEAYKDGITPSQCVICYRFIKTDRNMELDDSAVLNFTEPFEIPDFGLLVFVKRDTQKWRLAITGKGIPPDTQIPIHLCSDHSFSFSGAENIRRLKAFWHYCWHPRLQHHFVYDSFKLFIERFKKSDPRPFIQAQIIDPANKIIVIGDLHGSSKSVRMLMKALVHNNILDENLRLNPRYYLVFTGDYADRCCRGAEVWNMIIHLKNTNPTQVFLLKGNHETVAMTKTREFFKEIEKMLSYGHTSTEQQQIIEGLFSPLAHALLLGTETTRPESKNSHYRFLLFCHGGIDQSVNFHQALRTAIAAHKNPHQEKLISHTFSHAQSELSGLLWSDFFANRAVHDCPWTEPSERGEGLNRYNRSAVHDYLDQHFSDDPNSSYVIDAIIRGHEHIPGGITRLRETVADSSDWVALRHDVPEAIAHGSVYTCISSPEGLAPFGCFEDSYAVVEWKEPEKQWQLTPHIERRVPKRFAHLVQ